MNKLNCGVKIYWIAGLTQLIGFTAASIYFPSFVIPMFAGAFLIWFSIQVEILYWCWMYPAKIMEYQNRPRDWADQYEVQTEGSGCGWENVYQEEMDGPKNYGDIEIDDDEDDDDIIRPDLVTAEEIMEDYKKIGDEYSHQYKEGLAKELEKTGLTRNEYFEKCFGPDITKKEPNDPLA